MIAALLLAVSGPALAEDTLPDPHGHARRCDHCHGEVADGAAVDTLDFVGGSADRACTTCHETWPHEVGVPPVKTTLPEDLLLVDGLLACASCHDEPACDGERIDPVNPLWFRGGPYASVGELCVACHTDQAIDRFNPHEAMLERGEDDGICQYCHETAEGAEITTADLKVRTETICQGCHKDSRHAGSAVHLVELTEPMLGRAKEAGLPLAGDDRVICGTCHDPHPHGTLTTPGRRDPRPGDRLFPLGWTERVLAPLYSDRSEEHGQALEPFDQEHDFLRLPLTDDSLCLTCHRRDEVDEGLDSKE